MASNYTGLTQKQIADREQFRRYAEAALQGLVKVNTNPDLHRFDLDEVADLAFAHATYMMLAECQAFAEFELMALQSMIDKRNASDDAKPKSED